MLRLRDARFHHLAQIDAVDVLHHEEVAVVDDADVVDLRDVRVLERRDQPRLVEEELGHLVVALSSSRMRLMTTIFSNPWRPPWRAT